MTRPAHTATLAALVIVAITSCSLGDRNVPQDDLEEGVVELLQDQVGQPVTSVACDDDLAAEVDATVRCALEAADGSTIGLTVKATSVDGSNVSYEVTVDEELPGATTAPPTVTS